MSYNFINMSDYEETMSYLTQLNPSIPMYIPEKNSKGQALAVIDYGIEHDLYWVIALDNGEIWTLPNPRVRAQYNTTLGRESNNKE